MRRINANDRRLFLDKRRRIAARLAEVQMRTVSSAGDWAVAK